MSDDNKSDFCFTADHIQHFLHCGLCIETKPEGVSPRDWAQIEVGLTRWGIQVWCKRHECNVAHFDLQGATVVMDPSRQHREQATTH